MLTLYSFQQLSDSNIHVYVKQCRCYKVWYFSHLLEKYTKMQLCAFTHNICEETA